MKSKKTRFTPQMDIEKQTYDPVNKPSESCSSFMIILNFFFDILVLYIIYILFCLLILLSPCLFTIIKLNSRLKNLAYPIKILLLLQFSLILIPIAYVFVLIYMTIYLVIVLIIQTKRNLKKSTFFPCQNSKINTIENSMKSFETSSKLLESPLEKPKFSGP